MTPWPSPLPGLRLTYSQGLTRHSQALAHVGALDPVVAVYAAALHADPSRFAEAPTLAEVQGALDTLHTMLTVLSIEDYREAQP